MSAPSFRFQRTNRDGGRICLGRRVVAEIRGLELINFRPVATAGRLVGADVGVPLFWRQYGNHQDPGRSANSHRRLELIAIGKDSLTLLATGFTRSRSLRSDIVVTLRVVGGVISCAVQARLEVQAGKGWLVTPHPHHGEVTFCTLWPAGVFSPDGRAPKRFHSCLVQRGVRVERIAHHHLGSPDKHRIHLSPGDRFAWVLEDWNPVITLGPGDRAEAGVCAYMWDTHFGLKICRGGRDVRLKPGTLLRAAYMLTAEPRARWQGATRGARLRSAGAAADTPVWTGGRHTFADTFRRPGLAGNAAWPWETAVTSGPVAAARFARDSRVGCTDRFSLRICSARTVQAAWQATTLGPAFGEPAFRRGGRLRLTAQVRTRDLRGAVSVALRIHRTGRGNVFDLGNYEIFSSTAVRSAATEWTELTVTTPPLAPVPDRVHVLLRLTGRGTAWFDDVEFERVRR
ncbi:MAG: hypothetical protein KF897_04130 [Opitutaceae bacterium]|nr:hypothetical protein [Opitutaceae bacterium]